MTVEIVSVIITFLSVLAVIWFGLKSQRLARENTDLQRRLLEIEEEREQDRKKAVCRAQLRAELREIDHSNWRLFVINTGQGTARNVTINLDGKPLLEHPAIPNGEQETTLIGPESEISYCMAICFGCKPPFELAVTWDDVSGQQGQYITTLTF